jgi:CRP/FNR family transcriptional regulator, cyclic AMP receptor protein
VAATFLAVDSAALAQVPLFAQMQAEQRDQLAGVCADLEVEAGTTLVAEGDFGFAMFVVKEGAAEVHQNGKVLRSLGPGDVFGEIAVLSGGRRTATVTATTPMRLISVMNRDVWRLERESPEVGASLRAAIADCLNG